MAATKTAVYTQNSSQSGLTVAGAFPQVTPNGVAPQNLDLIQIASKKGNAVLAVVNSAGAVSLAPGLTLTQVSVSGTSTTYTGTITGGGTNAFAGKKVLISGFVNGSNNGTFLVRSSTATTLVVTTVAQVNETHAANALLYTRGVRIIRTTTDFSAANSPTLAQLFANAFKNPAREDILQVVNAGGNVHFYVDYLGVAHGS